MMALQTTALTTAAGPGPATDDVILAVVLPAWRSRFLGAALDSLRAQTDRRFRVYVGDDASPDDIAGVVARYGAGLDLVYHRFAKNLGGRDLMAHWHRCIALTRDEPWLWVFSDDDELEPECVAAFHKAVQSNLGGAQLLRFNHDVIDAAGHVVERPEAHPAKETAGELVQVILESTSERKFRAQDHVFTRNVYQRQGGFFSYPLGMYADLATWIRYAEIAGIVTIKDARVRWRMHEQGTSSGRLRARRPEQVQAVAMYCVWLLSWVEQREPGWRRRHRRQVRRLFLMQLHRQALPTEWGGVGTAAGLGAALWGRPLPKCRCALAIIVQMLRRHMRNWPGLQQWAGRRARSWQQRNQARIAAKKP